MRSYRPEFLPLGTVIGSMLVRVQLSAPFSHLRPPDNRHHSQPVTSAFSMVRKFGALAPSVQIEGWELILKEIPQEFQC